MLDRSSTVWVNPCEVKPAFSGHKRIGLQQQQQPTFVLQLRQKPTWFPGETLGTRLNNNSNINLVIEIISSETDYEKLNTFFKFPCYNQSYPFFP